MVRLERAESLQREIRKDDIAELVIPTVNLARKAVKEGNTAQALKLIDYGLFESRQVHDMIVQTTAEWLDYIAANLGEEHVAKVWGTMVPNLASTIKRLSIIEPKEKINQIAETFRSHLIEAGEMTITEEADRFVIVLNPCGSGGKMRRKGKYGITRQAYQWSWNKTGVPYYCTHCCIFWELTGIEVCGYPLRIHENVDKPLEPCIQYVYKRPELIPEIYFTRLGKLSSKF